MIDAANAAKESADAAVAANRAILVPNGQASISTDTAGINWINLGKTPAMDIRYESEAVTVPIPWMVTGKPPTLFTLGCPLKSPNKYTERWLWQIPQESHPVQMPKAQKDRAIHVHGCFSYMDILANRRRGFEFCGSVVIMPDGKLIAGVGKCGQEFSAEFEMPDFSGELINWKSSHRRGEQP
jgi:hypothetical protein